MGRTIGKAMSRLVSDRDLEMIKALLVQAGINTTRYQDGFLKRRIQVAYRRSEAKSHEDYLTLLKNNPKELKKLEHIFSIHIKRLFEIPAAPSISDWDLGVIKRLLEQAGFDISRYTDGFLRRRINIAFRRSSKGSYHEYIDWLKQNPDELRKLEQTFVVNVTNLIRIPMGKSVSDPELETIKALLAQVGFNSARYKDSFLKRRVNSAIRRSSTNSREEYLNMLKKDPEELKKLAQLFSINVTRFFRNYKTYELLETVYLPQLIAEKNASGDPSILVWSVGCANGAEPYTFAILFSNLLGEARAKTRVRIIGTDYNPDILKVAEQGMYPAASMEEVPLAIQNKYFIQRSADLFQLKPHLRSMVQFRLHDLLKDQPLKRQDIVVCRNVLIYFSRESHQNVFDELTKAVKHQGLLILGRIESIPVDQQRSFQVLNSKHRIYKKFE